jgi:3-deoxy-manno-octulosonate cytidylyltransferase (CMP-KDO synthetase)
MTKLQLKRDSKSFIPSIYLILTDMKRSFLGIIPARYASSRFPGKPMAMIAGQPMIRRVWDAASVVLDHLVVATDDQGILETVLDFGGRAFMTSDMHTTGTERCAEALELYAMESGMECTHVINIQGDEPLLHPSQLHDLQACFEIPDTEIATLVQPILRREDLQNPNVVKVVCDKGGRALYFSRSSIPFSRDIPVETALERGYFFRHLGLYAYRSEVLGELVRLEPGTLERAESLEQLRWLENGRIIRTRINLAPSLGVDSPEDIPVIEKLLGHS